MLWNGNACGRNLDNENFKVTLLSTGYVRSELEKVEYRNYFRSVITNDVRCARETKPSIAMVKKRSTRRRLFTPANWT
jgi:hypothetical protein